VERSAAATELTPRKKATTRWEAAAQRHRRLVGAAIGEVSRWRLREGEKTIKAHGQWERNNIGALATTNCGGG
jgi:hypothetical protein